MYNLFGLFATGAATLGLMSCVIAGLMRLVGHHHFMGFESVTLFIVGIALMVAACLAKLYRIELNAAE